MKKLVAIAIATLAVGIVVLTSTSLGQESLPAKRYEYAIVKWDGPDCLYYNLPDKFEVVHLGQTGTKVPKEAQAEEFCLTVAVNTMAKDGWEPINLNSKRILFRRAAITKSP